MRLPKWWHKERQALARAILKRTSSSSFELLLKEEVPRFIKPNGMDFQKEKELKEVLNALFQTGKLRAHVMLTNQARVYTLFYNPRRYQP